MESGSENGGNHCPDQHAHCEGYEPDASVQTRKTIDELKTLRDLEDRHNDWAAK